ncbi:MAG: hypothetical protein K5821_06965 [Nitrobacter sp.]|uniref:hypothetical protein n=1 Tax=Nitrobacter sp. TaxID=29420 RepID=UPI00262F1719|nr:hypothetical protein [Nitrobacter sp.]MCV0386159.1 hypothetical protein [Nitrobacter sp.]
MEDYEADDLRCCSAKAKRRPDLTFVPLERRALVQSRIEVIENYLENPSGDVQEAIKAANKLGLSISSFYRLVRNWRSHGDARQLAGSGAKSKPFAKRVFGDEAFIAEAIAFLPSAGTVEQDMEAIAALAVDRGVAIRSLSALRKEIRRLRPEYDQLSVPGDMVIARTAIEMPVQFGSRIAMPVAIVVAETATARILSIQLQEAAKGPNDYVEALLATLAIGNLNPGSKGASSLTLGGIASEDHSSLKTELANVGLRVTNEIKRGRLAANEWVSRRLRSLDLKSHPRLAHQKAGRRDMVPNSDLDAPVTLERAQSVVNSRIKFALNGATIEIATDETALISVLTDLLKRG